MYVQSNITKMFNDRFERLVVLHKTVCCNDDAPCLCQGIIRGEKSRFVIARTLAEALAMTALEDLHG